MVLMQELIKNKLLLIGTVAIISLLAGASMSTPLQQHVNPEITYRFNSENYIVFHTGENTFDIYQSDDENSHLTGTYIEYSDRYILTFSGFPLTQTSYKVDSGIQALRPDGTLGKVWNKT